MKQRTHSTRYPRALSCSNAPLALFSAGIQCASPTAWRIHVNRVFVPGQRWLSEAEPDLGLGTVIATDGRQVRLHFAASDETRNYAARSAPLSRVRFNAGDRVRDGAGQALQVVDVTTHEDLLTYHCEDDLGRAVTLIETALDDRLRLNRPQDKLLSQRIDADTWFRLRYQAWLQSAALWRSPVFGLQGPRVELIPHQLYIAAEVTSRTAPRVLLADEVGLGKTIEAGLILHRLVRTERVQRVLVVVPNALVHQWLVEMLRRFNLLFAVFDSTRFAQADNANPFHAEQFVVCSLSFLTSSPPVSNAVLAGDWDLLIVDEAHHLHWTEQETGLSYQLVEALAGQTGSVLLLTATPEQLGRAGHFGRLRLLDPRRFHDYQAFSEEETSYAPVAALAAKLLDETPLQSAEQAQLDALLDDAATLDRDAVIARLIDRHGTGRVLFRNTRHAIKGFPGRRLHTYPLVLPAAYAEFAAHPQPEHAFGDGWVRSDPRVGWLETRLRTLQPDKALVICAHAQTVIDLRNHLLERAALHAAVFHEGMEIVARDRAAAFFADPEQGAQVLICSEIGSEGRNFQFAHHLVLFDLPMEPDLLEQRIGRLDRIGQHRTVELHVPYFEGAASAVLLRWFRDGLSSFEQICPAASAVYTELREELSATLADPDGLSALLARTTERTAVINGALETGRDRLLELHSHQPERAAHLVKTLREPTSTIPLPAFMADYWDGFGVEHEPGPGASTVLRPGAHMRHEHFPGLPAEGTTVTFDRCDALAHEDRQFLTWEHPMVLGCMEMLTSGELGSAAVTVCSHPEHPAGTLFVELLYLTECAAPVGLQAQRFLPPSCVRLLLDKRGDDWGDRLDPGQLHGLCLSQHRKLAQTVIRTQADRIKLLLQHAETLAAERSAALTRTALAGMHAELNAEISRLADLAKVSPNVRQDELEQLALREERLARHLADTRVRLDAVRLIVMR